MPRPSRRWPGPLASIYGQHRRVRIAFEFSVLESRARFISDFSASVCPALEHRRERRNSQILIIPAPVVCSAGVLCNPAFHEGRLQGRLWVLAA
jgi:hypothetical protein